MKRRIAQLILVLSIFMLGLFLLPFKKVILFTEQRTNHPESYYIPLTKNREFQMRYVHSIHLTDVLETYEVTEDEKIRFKSMTYENIGIGLPGSAGEGEGISIIDGMYTLTYDDHVIDSFTLFIATIDTDLAFQYEEKEFDLKKKLVKGNSYKISVEKLSTYQIVKGVNLYDERSTGK